MKGGNGSSGSLFRWRGWMKDEAGGSNFVFPCLRKMVGTKVHKFYWFMMPKHLMSLKGAFVAKI